jgi:hypothetical protein
MEPVHVCCFDAYQNLATRMFHHLSAENLTRILKKGSFSHSHVFFLNFPGFYTTPLAYD